MTQESLAFGALLRRFRTLAGLTQEELAERASLSVRGISDLERGINTHPRPHTVHQLADALRLAENDRQVLASAVSSPRVPLPTQPTNNLPSQLTPMIGRECQIEAVRDLICRPHIRLVTLTGPGGVGKTRLALAVVAGLCTRVHDGVVFVELQALRDPKLVPSAIAAALGVRESGDQALTDTLVEYLRGRQFLLVLDNFEQILPAASFISHLLAACPQLTLLVTSRTVLHVSGEHVYLVPPLDLPDLQRLPPLDAFSQIEAIRLFVERARMAGASFALTPANAHNVAAICSAVDGLPLAIELAAARIRMLSPQALLTRLEKRLYVLTNGPCDLPARQQTMRAAIAWSHDLLAPAEQRLFRQLAVFVGGWTLEAAEAVCDQDLDVFQGIAALVDQSLIRPVEHPDGTTRFTMLAGVRAGTARRQRHAGRRCPAACDVLRWDDRTGGMRVVGTGGCCLARMARAGERQRARGLELARASGRERYLPQRARPAQPGHDVEILARGWTDSRGTATHPSAARGRLAPTRGPNIRPERAGTARHRAQRDQRRASAARGGAGARADRGRPPRGDPGTVGTGAGRELERQ